jgi:hypothetical protein
MSEERFAAEPDRSYNLKLVGIALLALAIFGGGAFWAYLMMAARTQAMLPQGESIPAAVRDPEVGIVLKTLFDADQRLPAARREQQARLNEYGWVDRQKGIIHIPIEQAMDRVVREGH